MQTREREREILVRRSEILQTYQKKKKHGIVYSKRSKK